MVDLVKGIDISIIQGTIDWASVVNAGYQFVVVRCGVGNSGIDANYAKNIAGAKAAGLKVAAYHFIYPLPPLASQPLRDPVKQAQYHFNAALGEISCIDCEWPAPQDWTKWGCTATQLNQWMLAYLAEYERLDGRKPLIYTYPDWASNVNFDPKFAEYSLWIASYQAGSPFLPHPWTDWVLWQNGGGTSHLPNGVPVDTDAAKDLSLWDTPAAAAAPVEVPQHQPDPTPVPIAPAPTPVVPTAPPAVAPAPVSQPQTVNLFTVLWRFFGALLRKK